jgi:hypothetical protein
MGKDKGFDWSERVGLFELEPTPILSLSGDYPSKFGWLDKMSGIRECLTRSDTAEGTSSSAKQTCS